MTDFTPHTLETADAQGRDVTNHIAGTTLDDAFADFAWQTPRSDVA